MSFVFIANLQRYDFLIKLNLQETEERYETLKYHHLATKTVNIILVKVLKCLKPAKHEK